MKNSFRKLLMITILFTLVISITGCWDNMDINERAFASAVGIDKGENGDIELSLQVLRPNIISALREGGSNEVATWVSTTTGDTVFETVREQLKTINRKPYYSHLQMIVIGEELAREGIEDVMDFFFRDHEVVITSSVIIAKGMKAKDVINAESKLETIPSLHINGILENDMEEAKTRNVDLVDVLRDLTSPTKSVVIGNIEPINKGEDNAIQDMEVEGAAVFKKDKLIGYLDAIETRGYLFINDEVEGGVINIHHPMEEDKKISIEIHRSSGKAKPRFENGEVVFDIDIKLDGSVGDKQGSGGLIDEELLKKIEKETMHEIEDSIKKVIKVAQDQYETDFIGFGTEIHRRYPQYWKEIEDNWNDELKKLSININTKVSIKRTGLTSKPISIE